ncbi:MAG: hypothetical protein AB2L12_02290 [Smithellaceae bacterium]
MNGWPMFLFPECGIILDEYAGGGGAAMTYLYYANKYTDAGKIMQQKLSSAFDKSWMKRCRTIAEFSMKLHESLRDVRAAIVLIDNLEELKGILALKDILWEIKVIIIFSSQANISPMEVLALRPRFLTWTDSDLSQVVYVLGKMIKYEPYEKTATATSPESNTAKTVYMKKELI